MPRRTAAAAVAALLCWVTFAGRAARAADDIVVADFEGDAYPPGWTTTGTAFGTGPARGTLPQQQPVDGFLGRGLANSYLGGDGAVGTLASPPFRVDRDYISLLVGGGDHPRRTCVDLLVDGRVVDTVSGADSEHLDWVTWDVRPVRGKQAVVRVVDREQGQWGHISVDQITQSDHPPVPPDGARPVYAERLRPQFHFTSATNWINDPNGLVFAGGEYHLFFQHNPLGNQWGNMTWGHAVSPDLCHWRQLPDALRPDPLGTMFSGSAVVDRANTSGFGTGGRPPMVAMYTAAGGTSPASRGKPFTQCVAYSNDDGRTWAKFAGNPVIPNVGPGNRDPRVLWYGPTKRWVAVIYKADGADVFALFDSPDLKRWTHLQDFRLPGCSECPDLFPLPVDGDPARVKWVATAADGRYLVGAFDGHRFTPDQDLRQVDFGRNYYAVQTYGDAPDGRRVQVAWMRDGRWPRMPFNGQMSFPAELTLRGTPDGPRLFRYPVREVERLRGPAHRWTDVTVHPDALPPLAVTGDLLDVEADIDVGDATEVGLVVRGEPVTYSVADQTLTALGTAPVRPADGRLRLRVLADRTSIETFADGGRVSLTSCFLPKAGAVPLRLVVRGGTAHVRSLVAYEVGSAWPAAGRPAADPPS